MTPAHVRGERIYKKMIARKPEKFSLNSGETGALKITKEDPSSFFNQNKNKTAADAATSILKELGINNSSENESLKSKGQQKIYKTKKNQEQKNRSFKDLNLPNPKNEKNHAKLKVEGKKPNELNKVNLGFHENLILFVIFCILTVSGIAFVGGYLKFFDSSIIHRLTSKNLHYLEFEGEFRARQVENGYNRLPLLVVEGVLRNNLENSDNLEKIQLKAFAFDSGDRMIASHFTYAGNVLSDEQLEKFSPLDIKAIRHSEDLGILNSSLLIADQEQTPNAAIKKKGIPFQLVFFKSVKSIKRTSVQIVSYVRNNKMIFVRSPDLK
ncbi:MAG: hypothetical protein CL935_04210 [Deltaproteobacteria bacterium]|nr:hypothetical protein [Deltaproteobacteria bacterium]